MSLRLESGQRIFETGGYYRPDLARSPDTRITPDLHLILAGNSGYREQSLHTVGETLGMSFIRKKFAGPDVEMGQTSVDRAVHKIVSVAQDLANDNYFNRHPNAALVVVGADSQNTHFGETVNKSDDFGDFQWRGEQWRQSVIDNDPFIDHSGYAVGAMRYGMLWVATSEDVLTLHPPSLSRLDVYFHPVNFERARKCAGGLISEWAITAGDLHPQTRSGKYLVGQEAVSRVYGASVTHFGNLIYQAIDFIYNDLPLYDPYLLSNGGFRSSNYSLASAQ